MGIDTAAYTSDTSSATDRTNSVDVISVEPYTLNKPLFERDPETAFAFLAFGKAEGVAVQIDNVTVRDDGTTVYSCFALLDADNGVDETEFSVFFTNSDPKISFADNPIASDHVFSLARPLENHGKLASLSEQVRQNPNHAEKLDKAIEQLLSGRRPADVRPLRDGARDLLIAVLGGTNGPRLAYSIEAGELQVWGECDVNNLGDMLDYHNNH